MPELLWRVALSAGCTPLLLSLLLQMGALLALSLVILSCARNACAFFRMTCARPVTVMRADPCVTSCICSSLSYRSLLYQSIVSPGVVSNHVHQVRHALCCPLPLLLKHAQVLGGVRVAHARNAYLTRSPVHRTRTCCEIALTLSLMRHVASTSRSPILRSVCLRAAPVQPARISARIGPPIFGIMQRTGRFIQYAVLSWQPYSAFKLAAQVQQITGTVYYLQRTGTAGERVRAFPQVTGRTLRVVQL